MPESTKSEISSGRRNNKREILAPTVLGATLRGAPFWALRPPAFVSLCSFAAFAAVCCFCCCRCFCNCVWAADSWTPPLPFLTFQNVKNNSGIDKTPLTCEKVKNKCFVSQKNCVSKKKKTLVSQTKALWSFVSQKRLLYRPQKNTSLNNPTLSVV